MQEQKLIIQDLKEALQLHDEVYGEVTRQGESHLASLYLAVSRAFNSSVDLVANSLEKKLPKREVKQYVQSIK